MVVNGDLLLWESEMHYEEVVHSHERDGVNKAFCIQEALEIVVFLIFFTVFFEFKHIEITFSMPLLVLEIFHICDLILSSELIA